MTASLLKPNEIRELTYDQGRGFPLLIIDEEEKGSSYIPGMIGQSIPTDLQSFSY